MNDDPGTSWPPFAGADAEVAGFTCVRSSRERERERESERVRDAATR